MSSEMPVENAANPTSWPVLSTYERRVLGVLVEKAKMTPDTYPLSINALMNGANQKSSRDPILNMSEEDIEETLVGLQKKGLVTRITGGRVERWRHNLYDHWTSVKVELAVLTELLLRGPQTEGELRSRASRMEPIEDLDALRKVLHPLTERGLLVFLGPEGRRGTLITHGFHGPEELTRLRSSVPVLREETESTTRPQATPPSTSTWEQSLAQMQAEIAKLQTNLQQLQQAHQSLAEEFQTLQKSLQKKTGPETIETPSPTEPPSTGPM